jgi:NADH:ubiquinone oxidoreductase subunit 5 (subunit L)/multisubunit Na+/H+ antiporter MnhA subunit
MQNAMNIKPSHPSRAWLLLPLLVFALVALTVGIVAHQTVRSPYTVPFFHLFFSDTLHMKVWLVTAALVLGFFQLLTASRIYELLRFPPKGRFYNIVHRWSGRVAIALTVPVAYHCISMCGETPGKHRVFRNG